MVSTLIQVQIPGRSLDRAVLMLALALALAGCRSYVESTPAHLLEGDDPANYARVFRESLPPDVVIIHSAVVTYSFRPGVVTTDDFEFELVAPPAWIAKATKRFHLRQDDSDFIKREFRSRRERARPWYAPGPLDGYELYRDVTSVGYVHILVQKETEADGRQRVYISKH